MTASAGDEACFVPFRQRWAVTQDVVADLFDPGEDGQTSLDEQFDRWPDFGRHFLDEAIAAKEQIAGAGNLEFE